MPAVIFATSFLVGLSGALMPGPLLTLNIGEVARRGFWAGPALVLGHIALELLLLVALALGLSRVLSHNLVTSGVGFLGGLFLVFMGWNLLTATPGLQASGSRERQISPVVAGGLVSLGNPYFLLWWATIGASYVLWALDSGLVGLASFYSGHILSDLSWYSLVSFLVASGRKTVVGKGFPFLIRFCGLFLVGLGGYFLLYAFRNL